MLDLNERSAMQNYYLLKKLPSYVHVDDSRASDLLKLGGYFSGNPRLNSWENRQRLCQKQRSFYHDINETIGQAKLDRLAGKLAKHATDQLQLHREHLSIRRETDHSLQHERRIERLDLQIASQQKTLSVSLMDINELERQDESMVSQRVHVRARERQHTLAGRVDSTWNEVNGMSKKHIDMSFTKSVIDKDNDAFVSIASRIVRDEKDEELRKQLLQTNITKIRKSFVDTSWKNHAIAEKAIANRTSPKPIDKVIFQLHRVRSKSSYTCDMFADEKKPPMEDIKRKEEGQVIRKVSLDQIECEEKERQAQQQQFLPQLTGARSALKSQCTQRRRALSLAAGSGEQRQETRVKTGSNTVGFYNSYHQSGLFNETARKTVNLTAGCSTGSTVTSEWKSLHFSTSEGDKSQQPPSSPLQLEEKTTMPLKYLKKHAKHRIPEKIDQLAQPKSREPLPSSSEDLSRGEFAGLLCSESKRIDPAVQSIFQSTMFEHSQLFKHTIINDTRKQTNSKMTFANLTSSFKPTNAQQLVIPQTTTDSLMAESSASVNKEVETFQRNQKSIQVKRQFPGVGLSQFQAFVKRNDAMKQQLYGSLLLSRSTTLKDCSSP